MTRLFRIRLTVMLVVGLAVAGLGSASATWKPAQKINTAFGNDRDIATYAIAPDAAHVVYSADVEFAGRDTLYSVPFGGGTSIPLSPATVSGGVIYSFEITADSATIVYMGEITAVGSPKVYSVGMDGANDAQIAAGLTGQLQAFALADSSHIVLTVETAAGKDELYAANIDGSGMPIKLNKALPAAGSVTSFAISADGQWVVYRADADINDQFELYSVRINGTGHFKLSGATVAGGDISEFAIAPNSQRVVFMGDLVQDEDIDLYSRAIDGSALTAILDNSVYDLERPLISPDSQSVAYVRHIGTAERLMRGPIDQNDPNPVSQLYASNPNLQILDFQFSPNSVYLAYRLDIVPGEISAYSDRLGGTDYRLGPVVTDVLEVAILPDSQNVLVLAGDPNVRNLYFDGIDGPNLRNLSQLPGTANVAEFAVGPQGDYVIYRADRSLDETYELFGIRIGGDPSVDTIKINGLINTFNDVIGFAVSSQGDVVYQADTIDDKYELFSAVNLYDVFFSLIRSGD